ncbi:SWIM zinc finger family protein [Nocardiopsis oceani]
MGAGNQICTSWWAHRLMEGMADGDHVRMARGRTYLRKGAVSQITVDVDRSAVVASVGGSRGRPYRVSVVYQKVEDHRWERILDDLSQDADAVADLLSGEMPPDIDEVFADHGVRLFPDSIDDFGFRCTCPDWGNPCKHGAAVLYALASLLDDEPLLLFTWLGRPEDEVVSALEGAGRQSGPTGELEVEVAPLAAAVDGFWVRSEPARLAPQRPFDPLAHWEGATPGVASRLAPVYERLGRGPVR